jgi:hypothetical protein
MKMTNDDAKCRFLISQNFYHYRSNLPVSCYMECVCGGGCTSTDGMMMMVSSAKVALRRMVAERLLLFGVTVQLEWRSGVDKRRRREGKILMDDTPIVRAELDFGTAKSHIIFYRRALLTIPMFVREGLNRLDLDSSDARSFTNDLFFQYPQIVFLFFTWYHLTLSFIQMFLLNRCRTTCLCKLIFYLLRSRALIHTPRKLHFIRRV